MVVEKISQVDLDRLLENGWKTSSQLGNRYELTKEEGFLGCFLNTAAYALPGACAFTISTALAIPACVIQGFASSPEGDNERIEAQHFVDKVCSINSFVCSYFAPCEWTRSKEVEVIEVMDIESDPLLRSD